jgi:hypothetical protein
MNETREKREKVNQIMVETEEESLKEVRKSLKKNFKNLFCMKKKI